METDLKELVEPYEVETEAGTVRTFFTTTDYLDCACEEDYMHPASEVPDGLDDEALESYVICQRCGTFYEDAPDSRANEVLARGQEFTVESLERHGPPASKG